MPKKSGKLIKSQNLEMFRTSTGTNELIRVTDHNGTYYVRPKFFGDGYDPKHDKVRLTGQLLRIKNLMEDGVWRTLGEIAEATKDPEASISAQLRNLRREEFGSWTVQKRSRGNRKKGLYEYRLVVGSTSSSSLF